MWVTLFDIMVGKIRRHEVGGRAAPQRFEEPEVKEFTLKLYILTFLVNFIAYSRHFGVEKK